uniref:Cadherin domain-containing protein n=1 Tax=Plectus sambesii TaxID=2011161 RepID=A0A914V2M4_9BILA
MTVTTKQKIDASTTEVLSGPTEVAVAIRLRDVNDNAPVFVDSNGNRTNRYHFEISNEVAQGQLIGRVAALDMDRGDAGKVEYVGINITEFFKLEEDGSITIAKALPRPSTVLAYSFVIEARDLPANRSEQRHSMANVDIAIDPGTDGRLPRFNNLPKTVAVSESFPRLSLVFTVDA